MQYLIGGVIIAVGMIIAGLGAWRRCRPTGTTGTIGKSTLAVILGGYLVLTGVAGLLTDTAAGTTVSILTALVTVAVGATLLVIGFRDYRRHPEWNRLTGPQVFVNTAGMVLVMIGTAGLFLTL